LIAQYDSIFVVPPTRKNSFDQTNNCMNRKTPLIVFAAIILLVNTFSLKGQNQVRDTLLSPLVVESPVITQTNRGARVSNTSYDSPGGNVKLVFNVYDNALQYQVFYQNERIIANSNLGLKLASGSDYYQNIRI